MGPIRYGGYRPPRESFVRLKVGGEDEDGEGGDDGDDDDDGDDGDDGDGDDGIAEPVTPPTRSETTDFFNDLAQRFHTI